MPRFSIVMTCYNHRAFIGDAVRTALTQTLQASQIIVVDDNSTDGSQQVLDSFGDAIVAIKNKVNVGSNRARNIGASLATGDYIVFLDGDDLFCHEALEAYSRVLEDRSAVLVLCQLGFFGEEIPNTSIPPDKPLEFVHYARLLLKDHFFASSASSIVVARDAFEAIGGWSDVFPCEDTDLFLRIVAKGSAIQILSPETALKREHQANYSRDVRAMIRGMFKVLDSERADVYNNSESLYARYCFLGGPAFYWIKKGFAIGAYDVALRLILRTWPMVAAAVIHKMAVKLGRRSALQSIPLRLSQAPEESPAESKVVTV